MVGQNHNMSTSSQILYRKKIKVTMNMKLSDKLSVFSPSVR